MEPSMMNDEHPPTLLDLLATLPDPRVERTRAHHLVDIVFIALCAIICGADCYVRIEEFGQAHEEWLRNFLELPNGIPSHDTFGRVFGRLNPKAFADIFLQWVRGVAQVFAGEVVSIDGKRIREASRRRGKNDVVHVVSAWAAANHLVLGQLKTEEKSNEITAIPELLKTLLIRGCIVTIDAEGCQKNIAKQIVDQEADYVLALKGNHDHLHHEVSTVFALCEEQNFVGTEHSYHETLDKDHAHIGKKVQQWHGLNKKCL
jgi:predicted transposase YbfD/YdcC